MTRSRSPAPSYPRNLKRTVVRSALNATAEHARAAHTAAHVITRTMLWRRLDTPGHDACAIAQTRDGWRISGVAVFLSGKRAAHLSYEVHCTREWITRNAVVEGLVGTTPYHARIVRSARGRWKLNGVLQPQLDGCEDLDIGFTPATNTIALQRLALAGITRSSKANAQGKPASASMNTSRHTLRRASATIDTMTHAPFRTGGTASVRAAWLNPENNEFSVLEQTYTKLSRTEYRYHSARFNFRATITVNAHRVVTNYPGLWKAEP